MQKSYFENTDPDLPKKANVSYSVQENIKMRIKWIEILSSDSKGLSVLLKKLSEYFHQD